jgi:hypothetical protein
MGYFTRLSKKMEERGVQDSYRRNLSTTDADERQMKGRRRAQGAWTWGRSEHLGRPLDSL